MKLFPANNIAYINNKLLVKLIIHKEMPQIQVTHVKVPPN